MHCVIPSYDISPTVKGKYMYVSSLSPPAGSRGVNASYVDVSTEALYVCVCVCVWGVGVGGWVFEWLCL